MADSHRTYVRKTYPRPCTKCGVTKPEDEFFLMNGNAAQRAARAINGKPPWRLSQCKTCMRSSYSINRKKWAKENPDGVIASQRKAKLKRYGISIEQYDEILKNQGGGCAICGSKTTKGRWPALHIDHDHITGVVRGILCGGCNVGLGAFGESLEKLTVAIEYIRKARG